MAACGTDKTTERSRKRIFPLQGPERRHSRLRDDDHHASESSTNSVIAPSTPRLSARRVCLLETHDNEYWIY